MRYYLAVLALSAFTAELRASDHDTSRVAPFKYAWGQAYHVLPETHNRESGYFSLSEGLNGRVYVGTTKYGVNSYLVEFDPKTEKQRIVIDTHSLCGLGITTKKEAQSKLHTRNFVGPSGKIYVGSMHGYADSPQYPGGYVMTYDPATGEAANLGMPQPGCSVIDVVADEGRGIVYVIPVDASGPWTLYDVKTKQYKAIGPPMTGRAHTLVDWRGFANAITRDYRLAQYNPDIGKIVLCDIRVDGKRVTDLGMSPEWCLAPDGKSAYLIQAADPTLYEIDLQREGEVVNAKSHGRLIEGKQPRCRTLRVGPDGHVYAVVRLKNETGFGENTLYHLVRFDPKTKKMNDIGVLAVKNPDFFSRGSGAPTKDIGISGKSPAYVGYHTLPDGTLTPGSSSACMAMTITRDGDIYVTILYPFTLLKIEGLSLPRTSSVLEPITIQD